VGYVAKKPHFRVFSGTRPGEIRISRGIGYSSGCSVERRYKNNNQNLLEEKPDEETGVSSSGAQKGLAGFSAA
jgi:hypothetical protein